MDDDDIPKKLMAFSHTEFATEENLQPRLLSKRVAERRSFFGHDLKSAPLSTLPLPVQSDPVRWSHMLELGSDRVMQTTAGHAANLH